MSRLLDEDFAAPEQQVQSMGEALRARGAEPFPSEGRGQMGLIVLPVLLPGRLDPSLLGRWRYEETLSRGLTERDRSAIYGGFHLYVLQS